MLGTKWKPVPPQYLKTTFSLPHHHQAGSLLICFVLLGAGGMVGGGDLLTNLYPENLSFPF